jgi:hypothetical protein
MLSLLVTNLFERIYATGTQSDPASALTQLDHYLRIGLNQDQVDSESDDGCDAMVLRIDPERQMIEFAGAKLNLYQVTSQKLVTRHVGARCSLGYKDIITTADMPVNQTIQYQSGDVFAAVTDGLTDQIGGPTGKTSYGYRRLADIIKANCKASVEEIAAAVKEDLAAWQGKNTRRDDLTAIFFKL